MFGLFACLELFLLIQWQGFNRPVTKSRRGLLLVLVFLVPLTSLFFGLQFSLGSAIPLQISIESSLGPTAMVFAAVPWILAGGFFGPGLAAGLALISGILISLWGTHNPFIILEYVLLAMLFAAAINQKYRTPTFRALRIPLVTIIALILAYPIVNFWSSALSISQNLSPWVTWSLAGRVEFALAVLPKNLTVMGIGLFTAGIFAQGVAILFPKSWTRPGNLIPSPAERSLQNRSIILIAPFAVLLIFLLLIGDWIIAGNAARNLLQNSMHTITEITSNNVPIFIEAGQGLMEYISKDTRLITASDNERKKILEGYFQSIPFFQQITLLDMKGQPVSGYPESDPSNLLTYQGEQYGISNAIAGVPFQTYSVPPGPDGTTAQVSFITPLYNKAGGVKGAIIGRVGLENNPYTSPIIENLKKFAGSQGKAILIDEYGNILAHPNPEMIMSSYEGAIVDEPAFYTDTNPDGSRQMVYAYPVNGSDWGVILGVPASRSLDLALKIAAPMLAMISLIAVTALVIMRLSLRRITQSLDQLASEAGRIAQGKLDIPIIINREDEVGNLRRVL